MSITQKAREYEVTSASCGLLSVGGARLSGGQGVQNLLLPGSAQKFNDSLWGPLCLPHTIQPAPLDLGAGVCGASSRQQACPLRPSTLGLSCR